MDGCPVATHRTRGGFGCCGDHGSEMMCRRALRFSVRRTTLRSNVLEGSLPCRTRMTASVVFTSPTTTSAPAE